MPGDRKAGASTQPVVARSVHELRAALATLRSEGRQVTLVPTMGALHDGHLSLVRVGQMGGSATVLSIFVNPTQFGPGEDLDRYPRQEAADIVAAADAGVDVVFAPHADEIYPEGFSTEISVAGPAEGLEGAARPTHFTGVATIVAKLVLAARPDRLVLGQKDAQQAAVVRRMLRDLHLDDVELIVGRTVREADGLALSSRNVYLDPGEREAALSLSRGLRAAIALAQEGEQDTRRLEATAISVASEDPRVELEYVAVVDPDSFVQVDRLPADALVCIAARVGKTRLIDNMPIPNPTRRNHVPPLGRTMLKSKIHRATVTDANLDYVGSITLDRDLLEAADIKPYEQVQILDINNGARFETYAIEGPRGGRDVCLNGPAARLVQPGDIVIVLTYADYPESELEEYAPLVVHVDAENNPVGTAMLETVPDGWESFKS